MNRRSARTTIVGAALVAVATLAALFALTGTDAQASPGDPLTGYGNAGTVTSGAPTGCDPCPTATSELTHSVLESGGGFAIHGYEWADRAAFPSNGDPAPVSTTGAGLAVTDGSATSWNVALTASTGHGVRVLAVGYQPSPAHIVAVVAVDQVGATATDPGTPIRQELRRYTTAGALSSTSALPVASDGSWATAAVAADGTVVGVENGSTGALDLPSDTIRRYDAAGTRRWATTLTAGDGIDAATVTSTGRVVLAGSTADVAAGSYDGLLAALTDSGAVDTTFGAGGRITVPAPDGSGRGFAAITSVGTEVAAVGLEEWTPTDDDLDASDGPGALIVARVTGNSLASSFDGDGIATRGWEPTTGERAEPTDVLLDGAQVVVSGSAMQADGSGPGARLLRFTPTGGLDDAFATDGSVADRFDAVTAVSGGYLVSTATPSDPAPASWSTKLLAFTSAAGAPVGPPAPGTPTVPTAGARSASVAWSAPSGGPTGYDVLVDQSGDGSTDLTSTVDGAGTSVTGLAPGKTYRFAVRARNAGGLGARSGWSAPAIPPFTTLDAFTDRQYLDFAGRAATTTERSSWRTKLTDRTLTPVAAVSSAVDLPNWGPKQGPVIRLYRAYFGRLPDRSGLDFWANKLRSGTSLSSISSTFAESSEFTRKYGTLTNRKFVELVYQNVLGRPGEASGVTYWTNQLDAGKKSRGQVMVNFSESNEYKRKTAALVDVIDLYTGLLRRVPTSGEVDLWTAIVTTDGRAPLIEELLGSAAYDGRIS